MMGLADIDRLRRVSPFMRFLRVPPRPKSGPLPRGLRLVGLALAAGAVAGMAAAGDIEASYREGRVAAVTFAAGSPPRATSPAEPAGDRALAHAHGFALAAQHRFRRTDDCRTVRAEFRIGCEDYVEQGRVSPAEAADGLAFAG